MRNQWVGKAKKKPTGREGDCAVGSLVLNQKQERLASPLKLGCGGKSGGDEPDWQLGLVGRACPLQGFVVQIIQDFFHFVQVLLQVENYQKLVYPTFLLIQQSGYPTRSFRWTKT